MENNYKKGEQAIIDASNNKIFSDAADEWDFIDFCEGENATCACGKKPIKWVYKIVNRLNNNILYLGTECIKLIIENSAYSIFATQVRSAVQDYKDTIMFAESIEHMLNAKVVKQGNTYKIDIQYEDIFEMANNMETDEDGNVICKWNSTDYKAVTYDNMLYSYGGKSNTYTVYEKK
jgi:hypothetical protein